MPTSESDYCLDRLQRNACMEAVKEAGMAESEFIWTRGKDPKRIGKLLHNPTGYDFEFRPSVSKTASLPFIIRYTPHPSRPSHMEACRWSDAITHFQSWVQHLKKLEMTPDLWAEAQLNSRIVQAALATDENSPFSETESTKIRAQLEDLQAWLIDREELNEASVKKIRHDVSYIADASERIGRKDWMLMALSTLFGLAVNAGLTSEAAMHFWDRVGQQFGWLWGNIPPLLN